MKEYFRKIGWRRIVCMVLGVVLLAIGVACMRLGGYGTDPFSCMNIGVSGHLPISYGTYQCIVNTILFIPVVLLAPRSLGIGALFNMYGLGYMVDLWMWLAAGRGITVEGLQENIPIRILFFLLGIVIMCYGVALYMESNLGIASYDMIGQIVDERTKGRLPFRWVRVATDLFCMMVGYLSGGTVGVGTVVVAFFTGPLVSWFRKGIANGVLAETIYEETGKDTEENE